MAPKSFKPTATLLLFFLLIFSTVASASSPRLNFLDINSGPSSGLGDNFGQGTIVTMWGNNLGIQNNNSQVKFRTSTGEVKDVAYTYYWKNADGNLPSGPADLYSSHEMQEIAVSIPAAPLGASFIYVEVNGVKSNELPFNVREGIIKFVAPNGDNKAACTFAEPCGWLNGDINGSTNGLGNQKLSAGEIIYSRGVIEPEFCGGGACVGLFINSAQGTEKFPISLIAYPDTNPKVIAKNRGVNTYLSEFINISKFEISVGFKDPSLPANAGTPAASNFHIATTKGRYVGNLLTQIPKTCFTGWSGAITSGGDGASNAKVYGNHIKELGCENSTRFQHTMYMSVRKQESVVNGWEIAWNHLHDNKSFYGIHNYDESYSGDCGVVQGVISIHDNLVRNQRGAGIHVYTADRDGPKNKCWEADVSIYNNLLVNVGIGPLGEERVTNAGAIRLVGDIDSSKVDIFNNTIYEFSDEVSRLYDTPKAISVNLNISKASLNVENNIVYSTGDYTLFDTNLDDVSVSGNIFYSTQVSTKLNELLLDYPRNYSFDPMCSLDQSKMTCDLSQGGEGVEVRKLIDYDFYGRSRTHKFGVGAVSKVGAKAPPRAPQFNF